MEMIVKICETCNAEFNIIPFRKDSAKYCSNKCKHAKSELIIVVCKICNKEFKTYPSAPRKYCSHACNKNDNDYKSKISKSVKLLHENPAGPYNDSWNAKRPKWQKGNKPWNVGLKYKRPEYSEWLKLHGHWKKGQSMEERFGIKRANEIKANLALLCSNRKRNITNEEQQKKLDYYKKVWKLTNSQPLHTLEHSNLRGAIHLNSEAYNLDHIIPIIFGYKNNIDPEIIADIKNLRFIPALQNHKKSYNDKNFNNLSDSE